MPRTDTASRHIPATAAAIYHAFTDPVAWVFWLPPSGMTGELSLFEPWISGSYRMTLQYLDEHLSLTGKFADNEDRIEATFVDMVQDSHVTQRISFVSDDPAFADEMLMTRQIDPAPGGCIVTIRADNVPDGISAADHAEGMNASLNNLSAYLAP